jgi:hypothetical protein
VSVSVSSLSLLSLRSLLSLLSFFLSVSLSLFPSLLSLSLFCLLSLCLCVCLPLSLSLFIFIFFSRSLSLSLPFLSPQSPALGALSLSALVRCTPEQQGAGCSPSEDASRRQKHRPSASWRATKPAKTALPDHFSGENSAL